MTPEKIVQNLYFLNMGVSSLDRDIRHWAAQGGGMEDDAREWPEHLLGDVDQRLLNLAHFITEIRTALELLPPL